MPPAARNRSRGKPKRSYHPEQSRLDLIESAVELFGTKGFHEASVQEIVAGAGLTKGAFYHHFESKEDVLHVIHDAFVDEHLEHQVRITQRFDRAHERLFHLVRALVYAVVDHRREVQIFYREHRALRTPKFAASYEKRDRAGLIYVETVALGVERGEFRPDIDPDVSALAILGMGNWAHLWFDPGGRLSVDAVALSFAIQALLGVTASPRTVRALAKRPIPDPDPAHAR